MRLSDEPETERRFLVRVRDCIWGEQIYPRIPPHERLIIDPTARTPVKRQIGWTVDMEPIYETKAQPSDIAIARKTLDAFGVVMLVQRMLKNPNVDRIEIKAV